MRERLWHVEVIVGELALVQQILSPQHAHPSAASSSPSPILPVVAVRVCNGPVLHVHFCDESDQSLVRRVGDEHSSLRREVAKTCYSEEGRFVFQRGKSCLFTIPDRDRERWDGRVEIVILNKLHDPPSVYGRCEAQLEERNGTWGNQALMGKLAVFNDREEIVSHLTVVVSCRDVGEDVALQIQSQSFRDCKKEPFSHTKLNTSTSHLPESETSQALGLQCNASKRERNITPTAINTVNIDTVHADRHVNQNFSPTDISNVSIIDHSHYQDLEIYPSVPTLSPSEKMEVDHIPSDQIAFMIKTLYNSKEEEASQEAVTSPQVRTNLNDELHQNFPLIRIRKNPRGEKTWNEKMRKLGGESGELSHAWKDRRSRRRMRASTSPSPDREESARVSVEGKSSYKMTSSPSSEISNGSRSSSESSKSSRVSSSNVSSLRRPTGWLRSTPIAPTPSMISHPKLNRTHFLRRASMDTQLAHQLQTEVDYQVKCRLKQIDEGLKEQLEKMQKVKVRKGGHGHKLKSQSVGCQTGDILQDNSLSPGLVEKTSVNSSFNAVQNYKEKSEVRNNEISNPSSTCSRRVKPKVLQKNLTFEIDVPEIDEDDHTRRNYEADLNVPVKLQLGNVINRQTDYQGILGNRMVNAGAQSSTPYRPTTLESLPATPSGDSKQKSPQDVASSYDTSVRDGDKKWSMLLSVDMTREPSQDTGQTYTIHDNLSRAIQSSQEDASEGYSQHSEYLSARSSNKTNADSHHSCHKSARNSKDSQSSSKASKRSLEVCKEILKGKQADSLTWAGSQLAKPQEYSSAPEEVISVDASYQSCSLGSIGAEEADSESEVFSMSSEKHSIPHVTGDYSGYGSSILSSYSQPEEDSIPMLSNTSTSAPQSLKNRIIGTGGQRYTAESMGLMKSIKPVSSASEINSYRGAHVPESSSNSKRLDTYVTNRADWDRQFVNTRKQKIEREGRNTGKDEVNVDSSVSDISARIAAMLVPRNLSVARINTDSVSSYIPSDLCNTMSSLSDMSQD